MRLSRWIAVSVLPVATLVTAARSFARSPDPAADHVRRHLDSVLVELRSRHVGPLSRAQQARRARLVAELAAYRDRGSFPHNYDFPGQLVPYFRDRETGALCAVGDLLAFSGRPDIVDRVVRANNNARVVQLAGDTAFRAWLEANGLTLAEAARIQVVYAQSVSRAQMAGMVAIAALAPAATMTSLITSRVNATTNADGHRKFMTGLGIVSSAATAAVGAAFLHSDAVPRWAGLSTTSAGALGVALAGAAIHRHEVLVRDRAKASLAVVPTVDLGRRATDAPRVGAALSVQF